MKTTGDGVHAAWATAHALQTLRHRLAYRELQACRDRGAAMSDEEIMVSANAELTRVRANLPSTT